MKKLVLAILIFIGCTAFAQRIYVSDNAGNVARIETEQEYKQRLTNEFLYNLFTAKDVNAAKSMLNSVLKNNKNDIEQYIIALQRIYILQSYLMDSVELDTGSYIDERGCLIYEDGVLVVN